MFVIQKPVLYKGRTKAGNAAAMWIGPMKEKTFLESKMAVGVFVVRGPTRWIVK